MSISFGDAALVAQAVALFATLIVMYRQFRETTKQLNAQLQQLRGEITRATSDSLFDKIFSFYRMRLENPGLFDSDATNRSSAPSEKQAIAHLYLLDFLYFMHLQWGYLDERLRETWRYWARKIFLDPALEATFSELKSEYPESYVRQVEQERVSLREATRV